MDRNGTYYYNDKSTKEFLFHHCSGFEAKINKNGQLSIKSPSGIDIDLATFFNTIAPDGAVFDTPELHSTGESSDQVRTMSGDREIYNSHEHPGYHGPTGNPTNNQ
jgi:hypothetical protein